MHNHQCPYCLRGTVPIDKKCNTPASSKATDTTTTTICRCQNRHTLLVNPELDHNQQNYRNNTISKSGCNILQQIQKIPSSNELLKKMYLQQSSKYFDGCCHNLAIYPVNSNSCDPLQIHCCRQEKRNCSNICWQHQYQNDSRINQLPSLSAVSSHHNTHPSNNNNNQINCNGCQYSDISFSPATTITNATYFSSPVYKSDCSKNNKNNCKCTKIACTIASEFYQSNNKIDENSLASSCKFDQYDVYSNSHHYFKGYPTTDDDKQFTIIKNSDLSALTKNSNYNKNKQIEDEEKIIIVENNKKMSSGKSDIKINNNNNNRNRSFKKSKKNELWTEFTKLLLGKGNGSRLHNNCKRNLRIESFTKSTIISIFTSIFLLIALLPSFTLAVPKVGTAYACEDKTLTIECEPGDTINIIRANFGRFSLTICNDHGNVDWSVNCMSQKSLRVLNTKCATKQNCSVSASASLFGDPCPGTRKYLEANYRCESAIHTTTVINRLSPPPWQVTSQPSVWSTSTIRTPTTSRTVGNQNSQHGKESPFEEIFNGFRVTTQRFNLLGSTTTGDKTISTTTQRVVSSTEESFHASKNDEKKLLGGGRHTIGGLSFDDTKAVSDDRNLNRFGIMPSMAPTVQEEHSTPFSVLLNTKTGDNSKNYDPSLENLFCAPTMARNLFWNVTRAGDVNVQPCPGGATGIAKWRCVLARNATYSDGILHNGFPHTFVSLDSQSDSSNVSVNNTNAKAIWYPSTPDLTQCRSLWLNSLEIRVNQRDSSLISIANDLSQVTSSKTLYGGDMLVTTKIIQTMSEKMTYDIETFPDQRQRETTVTELLHGVVKTGSNLLDSSQEPSWHDLSFEDQMRVATSLLTGLEDNAFLLADTINRERNVVQKVKNILLSVRILETRNIAENEVFPDSDSEQWEVSDDQIEIPKGALIENNEGGLVRIVFVAFDRLESILKPATIWMDSKLTSNTDSSLQNNGSDKQGIEPRKRILNSKVISASLGKGRHIQLSQPIRLVLKHLIMENVTNPSCVFWNYIDHAWSDDGCYVETTNRTHTTCMCNHLTNFAILMDVVDDMPTSLLSILDDNLRVLIYISISISIILIIVAIITLKMFNGLLIKSCRTTIYRNLYICLLFIEILFLVGIELTEDHVLCGFASAFLHCSFLSATGWIFFEGYQLYLTLTNDDMMLEVEKSSRILWYYLFTYGLAFLIVTISIAIDPFVYTRADYCVWMEQTNVFWSTFITPIIIFILINLVYSAMAINVMNKKFTNSLKTKEHTRLASASRAENVTMNKIRVVIFYLRCSFIFMTTFIFNWLFAFLYIKNQKWKALGMEYAGEGLTSTYGYLFIFFNTFQGVYIFVFHCIQNEKIRREYCKFAQRQSWLPNCLRCAQQPSGVPSTSSNNVQHQIGGENSLSGINNFPVGTCLPSGVPGGQLIPTGATMEGGGTLSRHPQMGTKGKRLVYGIDGMPETGTLRGQIMPMGSQTSPMSSTGSTQLIYNGTTNARHLQEWAYQHPESQINKNAFDERLLYYDTNAKNLKQSRSRDNELHDDDSLGQSHEVFHWTQGRNNKKHAGKSGANKGIPGTLTGSNRDIFPSYHKKHPHDHQIMENGGGGGGVNDENSYLQNYRRYMQAEADAEFLSQYQRQLPYNQAYPGQGGPVAQMGTNRAHLTPQQIAAQRYYQQHGSQYIEEPVYEEIVSSQMSSTYGMNDCDNPGMIGRNGRMSDDDEDMMDDDMEVESDDEERFPNGATDEEDSGSRSNKDDLSSRQSSSRPLIKSAYDYNQTGSPQMINGGSDSVTRQNGNNTGSAMSQQRQVPSRNLSAILDENNTVVCYLEPLSK